MLNWLLFAYWKGLKRLVRENWFIRTYRQAFLQWKDEKTFALEITAEGEVIRCLKCTRISYHREDIKHRYCSRCDLWHEG